MTSESTVVFYGLRFEVTHREAMAPDNLPEIVKARSSGLHTRVDMFASSETGDFVYYALIGREIGVIGAVESYELIISPGQLAAIMQKVDEKIVAAGLDGEAKIYVQWRPPGQA